MFSVIHHPVTTDPDYSTEESAFIRAMDSYMTANRRRFPTFREVLLVLKSLGYRQVAELAEPPRFASRPAGKPPK